MHSTHTGLYLKCKQNANKEHVRLLYTDFMETKWQPPPTETWSSLRVAPSGLHKWGCRMHSFYPSLYAGTYNQFKIKSQLNVRIMVEERYLQTRCVKQARKQAPPVDLAAEGFSDHL